jgi:GGDEF domain-containing protein
MDGTFRMYLTENLLRGSYTVDPLGTRASGVLVATFAAVGGLAAFGLVSLLPATGSAMQLAVALVGVAVVLGTALAGTTMRTMHKAQHVAVSHATTHPVTGLGTPHIAEMMLGVAFAAAQRGRPLTVVLLRFEDFPRYAARSGRASAEQLLRGAGRVLRTHTRTMHITAHHGPGDATFVSILSDIGVEGACIFAKRARRELMNLPGAELPAVSAAVVGFDVSMASPAELLERADRALAKAAEAGGRIVAVGLSARSMAS